jgi:hypothetical protein
MRKVIIALPRREAKGCNLTRNALYVAFSRVRNAENIRTITNNQSRLEIVTYLNNLPVDYHTRAFFKGLDPDCCANTRWSEKTWNREQTIRKFGRSESV